MLDYTFVSIHPRFRNMKRILFKEALKMKRKSQLDDAHSQRHIAHKNFGLLLYLFLRITSFCQTVNFVDEKSRCLAELPASHPQS
jgi:hypothetical protein